MQSALHSCPFLMKLGFSRQILEKSPNIKFHGNPSSGSRVVPYGRTDGRTDMTALIVGFRTFANAPKNQLLTKRNILNCEIQTSHDRRSLQYDF